MSTTKKVGVNKPIICKKCGHRVGNLRMKPAMYELLAQKNRKETLVWIFIIALSTQFLSDVIISSISGIWGHFNF